MNGVSISLYNKFDDLGIMLDIIRNNWKDEYFISVCSNHPDAEERIAKLEEDVDKFERGTQIEYSPSMEGMRESTNIGCRIYDTISTASSNALSEEKVDYVIHLHADAWQLSEQTFNELTEEMNERNVSVAFKSTTTKFLRRLLPSRQFIRRSPIGCVMDQFFVLDAGASRDADLFERQPLDFPPPLSPHTALAVLWIAKIGWKDMYQYSNRREEEFWDGEPILEYHKKRTGRNAVRPMMYNPKFGQLHIAKEDFRDGLGRALQAFYLNKHDLTEGTHIQSVIDDHYIPEDVLLNRLDEHFEWINSKLRWYGLDPGSFGRDLRYIYTFIEDKSFADKLRTTLRLHTEETHLWPLLRNIRSLIMEPIRPNKQRNDYMPLDDTQHKQSVNDYYISILDRDDYPDSLAEGTFVDEK